MRSAGIRSVWARRGVAFCELWSAANDSISEGIAEGLSAAYIVGKIEFDKVIFVLIIKADQIGIPLFVAGRNG